MYLLALHQSIDELDGVIHPGEYDPRRYRHAYERVASQLGHASVTTTMTTYLAPFEELRFAGALLRAHHGISAAMSALASSDARVLDLR
jgi:integrase